LRSVFVGKSTARKLDEGAYTTVLTNPEDGSDIVFLEDIEAVELR